MKKLILFLISMITIPCMLCMGFGLFSDKIQIGKGGNSLENHHLGKEVLIEINGLYKSMDVEEYVLGILPGTIPADYDIEALKVQAVLIRTNVLKEMQEKNTKDASDLSYHYMTMEERMAIWGEHNYPKYEKRLEKAVVKTAGKVIQQENSLIMALYHEVSIGKTASAKEILGEDISYLQSVESSQDVEAKHYMNIIPYTWEELAKILNAASLAETENAAEVAGTQTSGEETAEVAGTQTPGEEATEAAGMQTPEEEAAGVAGTQTPVTEAAEAAGTQTPVTESVQPAAEENKIVINIEESTENGFVKKLSVDGNLYSGEEAMERFALSSTNFYVEEIDGGIRFVCLGKGNCMGVSQYGANYLALNGNSMEDIIKYYYQGISLVDYKKDYKK